MDNYIVTGCARSGTTLLIHLCEGFEGLNVILEQEVSPLNYDDESSSVCYPNLMNQQPFMIKIPQFGEPNTTIREFLESGYNVICIYRDGKDVLVSELYPPIHPGESGYHVSPTRWRKAIKDMLDNKDEDSVYIVKYEDLVQAPHEEMGKISDYFDLEYTYPHDFYQDINERMMSGFGLKGPRKVDDNSIGNWKKQEHKERIEEIKSTSDMKVINKLLSELEYETLECEK